MLFLQCGCLSALKIFYLYLKILPFSLLVEFALSSDSKGGLILSEYARGFIKSLKFD